MADNTLVNEEGLLTTSPSTLADIANNPAEDSLLASDDEDIPCGQMSTERRKNTNPQENGDQPLQRSRKTNNTERRNCGPTAAKAVIVVYLGRIVMQMRLIAIQTLLNFGVMTDTIADTHGPSVTKNANCC